MAEDLIKLWRNSEPLLAYLTRLYGEEIEQNVSSRLAQYPKLSSPHPQGDLLSALADMTLMANRVLHTNEYRTEAFNKQIKSRLLDRQILAIGLEDDGSDAPPQIVPPEFWLRAKVTGDMQSAKSSERGYTDLRLLSESVNDTETNGISNTQASDCPSSNDLRLLCAFA